MTASGDYAAGQIDLMLADECSKYYADPYGWVMWAFDWGYGELEGFEGPDVWQRDMLIDVGKQVIDRKFDGISPVDPIREATASGHGIGKSAITAWLILWIMSTRPYAKGIVTANTSDQLRTKTWGELGKWRTRCIIGHWFEYNNGRGSMSLYHKSWPESWRVDAQTCREENSEAFAGLHSANSTPFYLFDEACHDDITEVLSDRGWLLFKDVTPDDKLLTMDTDTGDSYYDKPSHIHTSDYNGELLVCESRGANFAVTPNHKMLFNSVKLPDTPQFTEADNMIWGNKRIPRIINWSGHDVDYHTIPSFKSRRVDYPERQVKMDDWCEFMGWFITEGHTQHNRWKSSKGWQTAPAMAVVTQKQLHYLDEIIECVERMEFTYSVNQQGVLIFNPALCHHLDTFGKGFNNKRVPSHIKDLCPRQIDIFIDAAVKGDGYHKGTRDIIYTSSSDLAGDYQELILKTSQNSTVTKRDIEGQRKWIIDHWAVSTCDGYVVSRTFNQSKIDCEKAKPSHVHYEGKVYCATVSGGVLFTRRNGKCMWSGNSAVPDKIWEVAEGGLTDGEPMFFVFGNPTRNTGKFRECFNRSKHRWITRQIDSRTAKMTNKRLIKQWGDDWGEDSDFFRVRVLGRFPRAGDTQFIPSDVVFDAQKRGPGRYMGDDPLICGIDVARGGEDNCMIGFRRGKDAKSEKTYRIPGEKSRNSMVVISKITMILDRHKPDITFLDETGIGGPMVDRLVQLGYNVIGVGFGHNATDELHYSNKTAEMGARCRQWLMDGGAIVDDPQLEEELTSRDYWHDKKDKLVLESKPDMKKRIHCSPDWADQLYLTFAELVPKLEHERGLLDAAIPVRNRNNTDYNPLDCMNSDI